MHPIESTLRVWKHRLEEKSRDDSGDIVQSVILIALFVVAVGLIGSLVFNSITKTGNELGERQSREVDSTPSPEPSAPAEPVDLSMTLNVLLIVGIAIAVLIGGFFAVRALRSSTVGYRAKLDAKRAQAQAVIEAQAEAKRLAKAQRESFKRRRDHALASIADSELTQGRWEMDPEILINYPEFTNYSAEPVSALTKAYKVAVRNRDEFSHLGDDFTEDQLKTLEESATTLSIRLHAAQDYAKSVGWGKISFAEKKLMNRAKKLINVAANESVGEHERTAALKGLQGVLNALREDHGRVINVDKLTLAIEVAAAPKALESAKPSSTVEPFGIREAIAL